ncbi:uncharacterized protein L969DRAFT_104572 [Mixia osmundae IAM 14324]|uniref:Uncharacterized protein n=1 Tax=Mixia osmundae (strain CBS 9802 / IAM 14324 / JCM 22182 / KY 12970) TaxID=764103 RepID=G7DSI8_MIXOS|nr:uncharacterized protein L969DRAFT_104572 [Mixia osmundae IAM 14324]KEI37954.1 hypothetical protein L969DRAFT_104572 [Mixia osmundae IAM 14324]GAA93548.1 hypothetical protein E5Q_00192 [Mixia osmundae IAM 14324]
MAVLAVYVLASIALGLIATSRINDYGSPNVVPWATPISLLLITALHRLWPQHRDQQFETTSTNRLNSLAGAAFGICSTLAVFGLSEQGSIASQAIDVALLVPALSIIALVHGSTRDEWSWARLTIASLFVSWPRSSYSTDWLNLTSHTLFKLGSLSSIVLLDQALMHNFLSIATLASFAMAIPFAARSSTAVDRVSLLPALMATSLATIQLGCTLIMTITLRDLFDLQLASYAVLFGTLLFSNLRDGATLIMLACTAIGTFISLWPRYLPRATQSEHHLTEASLSLLPMAAHYIDPPSDLSHSRVHSSDTLTAIDDSTYLEDLKVPQISPRLSIQPSLLLMICLVLMSLWPLTGWVAHDTSKCETSPCHSYSLGHHWHAQLTPHKHMPDHATTKGSLDIVIAFYEENPADLLDELDVIRTTVHPLGLTLRTFIYVKSDRIDLTELKHISRADHVQVLANRGREGGTFLQHIIRRHTADGRNFADHTLFSQAHLTSHEIALPRLAAFSPHDTGYLHLAPYVASSCGFDHVINTTFPRLRETFNMLSGDAYCHGQQLTAWKAQFIVSRRRIASRPLRHYKQLEELVNAPHSHPFIFDDPPPPDWSYWGGPISPSNPLFGHALERSWPAIFNCSDATIASQCNDKSADPELCQCHDRRSITSFAPPPARPL